VTQTTEITKLEFGSTDYVIEVKVRNGVLLRAMRERGLFTGADLSRAAGVSITTVCKYLSLTDIPIKKNGDWRSSVELIADALQLPPEMLFPPQHITQALKKNRSEFYASAEDVRALTYEAELLQLEAPGPDAVLEAVETARVVDETLDKHLTKREKLAITLHFGLDGGEERTLKEIGVELGKVDRGWGHGPLSVERTRQIVVKAMRRLKQPGRVRELCNSLGRPYEETPFAQERFEELEKCKVRDRKRAERDAEDHETQVRIAAERAETYDPGPKLAPERASDVRPGDKFAINWPGHSLHRIAFTADRVEFVSFSSGVNKRAVIFHDGHREMRLESRFAWLLGQFDELDR